MDPDTTYDLLVDAIERGDHAAASLHAHDLRRWLRMGGYWPSNASAVSVRGALGIALNGSQAGL